MKNNEIKGTSDGRGRRAVARTPRGFRCSPMIFWVLLTICIFRELRIAESVDPPIGICAMEGCNCTVVSHTWTKVKCVFNKNQDIELGEGSVPANALDVDISQCRELRIQSGAITGGPRLTRVHVSEVESVVAKKQSFHNISGPNVLFDVSECNDVVLESEALKNTDRPLSVSISRCKSVKIKPNAFFWLLRITVNEVPNLTLSRNSFKFDHTKHGRHGTATKILFHSVRIPELPSLAFPSTAAEIRMDDLHTSVIRKDAFQAVQITRIAISNATISTIETGAFSKRTLISSLEFVDVSIETINAGAFSGALNNLTIQYSRVNEIETDAINIPVAIMTLNNNEFQNVRTRAIAVYQSNHISIYQNLFRRVESDAIAPNFAASSDLELSFSENQMIEAQPGSLRFAEPLQNLKRATIDRNYFDQICSCNLETWTKRLVGTNGTVSWLMSTSFCKIDEGLGNCFKVPLGRFAMKNFTSTICREGGRILCDKPEANPEPSASPPSVGPHVYPRKNGFFDVHVTESEQLQREKRIIVVVSVVVILCVACAASLLVVLYMRRRGICPKLTSEPFLGLAQWMSPSRGMAAATSARSISRMSVNEYAGLRPEARVLDVEAPPEDYVYEEGYAYTTENKATQTLPEELTEEYLKDLRERLNDPDNYSEARDMIEHLYDLIKVEESCNNNNNNANATTTMTTTATTTTNETERLNFGEERNHRYRRTRPTNAASTSVGTRAPSLDKLLPNPVASKSAIVEYAEPRDSRTADQNHLYAELVGDETVPSTSRLGGQQQVVGRPSLAGRDRYPLPPDIISETNESNALDRGCGREFSRLERPDDAVPAKNQTRPLSFLKALGESIMGGGNKNSTQQKTPQKRPSTALLYEYAEPSDLTTHLYSELSESVASTPVSKMANRPLPTKPDHRQDDATTKA